MTDRSLEDAWALLERLGGGDLRVHSLSADSDAPAAGVDTLGRHHVLFPIDGASPVAEDRRSGGIQITRHELEDERGSRTFVDVLCAKPHLSLLFSAVASEMIDEVAGQRDRPDLACHRVLERWRELIDRDQAAVSGPQKLAGAVGELLHLRALVRLNPAAISNWSGPAGSRHDFQNHKGCLEVKASLTRHGRFFEISSHEQLEPLGAVPLYFGTVKLERVPTAGVTVPGLVQEIGDMGVDRARVERLLGQAGLMPTDLSNADVAFRLEESLVYRVSSDFPAITSANFVGGRLPPGVLRLTYSIDLTSGPPHPLDESEVEALYARLAEVR